jgi:hypothetical protein
MKYYAVRKGHHPRIIAGEWRDAEPEIKKEISGFSNPEWKGFKTKAEADAYMQAAEPVRAASEAEDPEDALAAKFQFTADAVIFVDGSRNFDADDFDGAKPDRSLNKKKNFYFGSYGFLIFYRDGSVYVETARVADGEPPCIDVSRHGFTFDAAQQITGEFDRAETVAYTQRPGSFVEFEDRYVLASWNIAGEVEGAKRALDICFHEKNLGSVYVLFDCDQVDIVKKIASGKKPALGSNVTCNYGEFCRRIVREGKHVGTMHVYSHDKGRKKGIHCDPRLELFNSCADVLAKAETYNKPIDPVVENRPLRNCGLVPFEEEIVYSERLSEDEVARVTGARRAQAFTLIQKVLADREVRPNFV